MSTAVITGGTGGIGFHVARRLHEHGLRVTIVGRDAERGAEAASRIGARARFLQADLSSLREVEEVGRRIAADGQLQVLVNNIGGMWSTRRETVDGIEASFALNHLSPAVLTDILLDSLRAGAPSRIVDVTSSAITTAMFDGGPTYEDIEQPGEYAGMAVMGRAKLAHLAHNQDLARELAGSGITVLAVDPLGQAAASTPNAMEMTREILPPALRHLWEPIQNGMRRPADSVDAIVAAAVDPAFDGRSGLVLGPAGTPSRDLLHVLTPEIAASVRLLTERVLARTA
jgi:NAD(P)-dependent dehydrogenase (short-subunit alcohol dehydrogenase family)